MRAHKKHQYTTGLHVLQPEQQAQWMDVLAQSFQYDVYHLPGYHALAEERDEGRAHLLLYTEGHYFVAIPLLLRSIEAVPGLARIGEGGTQGPPPGGRLAYPAEQDETHLLERSRHRAIAPPIERPVR
jgi:hypothetical protein